MGLGWLRTERHGDRIVWHNGGTGGFRSFVGYSEVSGRAVLLMANGQVNLDNLGMHLFNPAFEPTPGAAPGPYWPASWAAGLLALIIVLLLIREGSKLPGFLMQVGIGVVLLNLLATLSGFLAAKLFRLPLAQQICVAIEVGIQNGTLAIAITAGLLNNPDMAVPAAVYSLLMYVTGFGAILYGRQAIGSASSLKY